LNVHPISIRDNFFNTGGHSLLAVLLLERYSSKMLSIEY